ncbi:hypothetical protein LWI29_001424 [Acer saccharum]|uniref:Uncharacterized protein n=1 Tax=Acer saccharum TaxID=4024 RepID=A0AA39W1N5_ACESA|nr:hypothetical protein LWI29_001424 [Acer saccharum]
MPTSWSSERLGVDRRNMVMVHGNFISEVDVSLASASAWELWSLEIRISSHRMNLDIRVLTCLRRMGKIKRPKRKPFDSGIDGIDTECMLLEEIRVTSLDPREIGSQPSGEPTELLVKIILRSDDPNKTVLIGQGSTRREERLTQGPEAVAQIPPHKQDKSPPGAHKPPPGALKSPPGAHEPPPGALKSP